MKLIRVAAGVLNQTPLDWDGNKKNILDAIAAARAEGVSILCLPELCITGYGCEDAFHSPGIQATAIEVLHEIVPHCDNIIVSVGLPLLHAGGLFNTACLIVNQKIVGFVAKQHLAGDGIHYEPRWFKRWPSHVRSEIEIGDQSFPIGDLVFDVGNILLGFEICEDAWVGERPGASLAARGVDVILNPSASHFAFDKHLVRQRFILEGARAFFVTYIYANLVGNEAGRAIYDGDAMIAAQGKILSVGKRFSFQQSLITSAVTDVDATRMQRARTGSFRPTIELAQTSQIEVEFTYPAIELPAPVIKSDEWEKGEYLKEEEFARAEALGLFDYMRKTRSNGFVVSLSGGADSSAIVCLIRIMIQLATKELGLERFQKLVAYLKLDSGESVDSIVRKLLTTAYQSTENSGSVTRNAAKKLADSIGAMHIELDVDPMVKHYRTIVEKGLGRELTWKQDDLALQNIQARARGPSVWMLANVKGALLLATSNRSEAAVGYATMDGDTCGGLSPIAGIDKAYLRRWLVWLEKHGVSGIGPIAALSVVNNQEPTAELRPPGEKQTDEKDLMPYEVLDAIERLAIRDKLIPCEILPHLQISFAKYSKDDLKLWIERFFRLWCRNQWKRERYAPSFHLDDENLDPKTWCRFPILSSGFERELVKLRAM